MKVVTTITSNRFRQLSAAMAAEVDRIVRQTAKNVEANAKFAMSLPHSGALYGNHRASAPGEAPAIDTGALINSIESDSDGPGRAIVASNMEYAVELEYGKVYMAPRPFFQPAAEAERARFAHDMAQLEDGMQ